MRVKVKFFDLFKDSAKKEDSEEELEENSTVRDLLKVKNQTINPEVVVIVEGEIIRDPSTKIKENTTVLIASILGGG